MARNTETESVSRLVFYVAGDMIWRGWAELAPIVNGA